MTDVADAAEAARRSSALSKVLFMIHQGACIAAFSVARNNKVQFNPRTLWQWLETESGPKRTYAWLVLNQSDWRTSRP